MLLRNPISNTKRFLQRTLQSVKSLFSTGSSNADYHKIPKTPPFAAMDKTSGVGGSFGRRRSKDGFDRLYVDYSDRWEKKKPAETRTVKDREGNCSTKCPREVQARVKSKRYQARSTSLPKMGHGGGGDDNGKEKLSSREERSWLVARKLKELQMMDMGDVDHVLDIEEVIHYYSRLSCPEYVEIVDKFFMDVYAEFFSPAAATPVSVNSRSRSSRLLRS
ncbi:unnamed protein product [Linum trigynum]|uniref:OVATE domain-containing protein n=1 Tax=Linum trigynum TaxID=586398 RepID=A0AAV2CSG8_9ROSI